MKTKTKKSAAVAVNVGDRVCSPTTGMWGTVKKVTLEVRMDPHPDHDSLGPCVFDVKKVLRNGDTHPETGETLRDPKIPNSVQFILE